MDKERVELIIRNMELLIEGLRKELKEEKDDTWSQQYPEHYPIDEYEPDYYEVED